MSAMHFVPLPPFDHALEMSAPEKQPLRRLAPHWLPFLPRIADRTDETIEELLDAIRDNRIGLGIVWDGSRAHALVGYMLRPAGRELIGEVHWITGWGTKRWRELLPELEQFLKDYHHCTIIKPICRPGWKPFLKQHGYKQTHVMMEKLL